MNNLGMTLRAEFSTTKIRCASCRNLMGLEQAKVREDGMLFCTSCSAGHREILDASLTPGQVEILG